MAVTSMGTLTHHDDPDNRWLKVTEQCLFGTSLTIADGVFTPAVSVTSAVAGIAVAKPSVTSDTIPISIAILVVLFLGQRFGTAKLAFLFAPGGSLYISCGMTQYIDDLHCSGICVVRLTHRHGYLQYHILPWDFSCIWSLAGSDA